MALKIEMRSFQLTEDNGTPYWWVGNAPNNVTKTTDINDAISEGFTFDWVDFSNGVTNKEDIEFTWQIGENDNNFKLTVSDELDLYGNCAAFVQDWLVERAYSALNIVEVLITDMDCYKQVGQFLIKPQKFSFCQISDCKVSVTMVSNNLAYDCLAKTKISDNWNGFQDRDFRAWDYAVEKRPAVQTALFFTLFAFVGVLGVGVLAAGTALTAIFSLLGMTINVPTFSDYQQMFFDIVGLGRAHAGINPREITENVCGKCGVLVDPDNNLFYLSTIPNFAGGSVYNWYQDMDIIFAQSQSGRKRTDPNKQKIIDANIPIIGLTDLYSDLAKVFNAKWYIYGNSLRFMPRAMFANNAPVLDFSDNSIDANRIINICLDITDKNPPLTADYGYQEDSVDLASKDVLPRYNSKASFDADGTPNPNLKGNQDKRVPFSTVRFLDDGRTNSYIDDATNNPLVYLGVFAIIMLFVIQAVLAISDIASLTPSAITSAIILAVIIVFIVTAVTYIGASLWLDNTLNDIIVMSQDVTSLPKLVIWDKNSASEARAFSINSTSAIPNPLFNSALSSYDSIHTENEIQPSTLRNYPLFFDTRFQDNVYQYFWSSEDLRVNALTKRDVNIDFFACCLELDSLGVYINQEIALDRKVRYLQPMHAGAVSVTDEFRLESISVNFTTKRTVLKGTNFN